MRNLQREQLIAQLKECGWEVNETGTTPRAKSPNGKVKLTLFQEKVQVSFSVGYREDVSELLKIFC
jgi:hypothetical protein